METPHSNKLLGVLFLIVACGLGIYLGSALLPQKEDRLAKQRIKLLESQIDSLEASIRFKDTLVVFLEKRDGVRVEQQKKLDKEIEALHSQLRVKLNVIDSIPSSELREKMIRAYENSN